MPDVDSILELGLAGLTPLERHVLIGMYFHHQTQRQIADQLSASRATIARAAARGLMSLGRFVESDPTRSDGRVEKAAG